jgi:hypothetical protein
MGHHFSCSTAAALDSNFIFHIWKRTKPYFKNFLALVI